MNNTTILEMVREGFEEQKGIKILSLFFSKENLIEGIYILPPQQSLSFLELPLLDMYTDFMQYKICLVELGQVLQYSYKMGSLYYFNNLIRDSEINLVNKSFDKLVNHCKNNPPMQIMVAKFIEWIDRTDETNKKRTEAFLAQCERFDRLDKLEYNKNLDISNSADIYNEFNRVKQQLSERKYKKITELTMNEIDKMLIEMQIDLYTTDDKELYKNV